ncbi:MAG: polysaccharide deacetylase family protein [Candidatus Korobacteraceae bacterium]
MARERGLQSILWAAAGKDWQTQAPEAIEANVLQGLQGGEIVLLHDGSPAGTGNDRLGTVQAVDRLIPRLRDHGYALVTVEQMLQSSLPSGDPQSGNAPPGYL